MIKSLYFKDQFNSFKPNISRYDNVDSVCFKLSKFQICDADGEFSRFEERREHAELPQAEITRL